MYFLYEKLKSEKWNKHDIAQKSASIIEMVKFPFFH
jgi:hypothetical protein